MNLADLTKRLIEAGAPPEAIQAAIEWHAEAEESRKAKTRVRVAKHRASKRGETHSNEKKQDVTECNVTSRDETLPPHSPPPNAPQTPKTPPPISPPDCPDGQLSAASADAGGSAAEPIDDLTEAFEAYQRVARKQSWPVVKSFTRKRRSALRARIAEHSLADWGDVLRKAAASPHCNGENDRAWTASFDFLTSPSGFTKTLEGNYDRRTPAHGTTHTGPGAAGGRPHRPPNAFERLVERLEEAEAGPDAQLFDDYGGGEGVIIEARAVAGGRR